MRISPKSHFNATSTFLAVVFVLMSPLTCHAVTPITLEWEPIVEDGLVCYRIFSRFEGEAYAFDNPRWEGTQSSCVIDIPDDGLPCYFVVLAIGAEAASLPSNEVCFGCDFCVDDMDAIYTKVCGCGIPDLDLEVSVNTERYDSDDDNDGIENEMESNGPNQGDGNYDGILDSRQCNVGSTAVGGDSAYLVIESPEGTRVHDFKSVDNPSPDEMPQGVDFPFGFHQYEIRNLGSSVDGAIVTITMPEGVRPDAYYVYGMTSENQTDHWYEFLHDGETGVSIDDNIITLHLADTLRGDRILTYDGMVIGLGAPGFIVSDVGHQSNSNPGIDPDKTTHPESDGGCFVESLSRKIIQSKR